MRTLVGAFVAGVFLVGLAGSASAVESNGPNFTFGASTSYVYDFNNPKEPDLTDYANHLSYANQEGRDETFNLDLVQLGISGSRGKGSYGAKLDFGDLARYAGDDSDGDVGVQTAYLSYDMGGAALTAGRFDTPIGYEVLEPWGNANVSRSYSWTLMQPINHDGAFVSGHAGILDGMIGVANDFFVHDQGDTPNDNDDEKAVLGAVGVGVSDALNLYFSMLYNRQNDTTDQQLYNAIVSGNVPVNDSAFRYALEANYADNDKDKGSGADGRVESWSLVAYAGADFGPCSLDLRGEYLNSDPNSGLDAFSALSAVTSTGEKVELWDISATAGWYMTDGLQFRLEYRYDASENGDIYREKSHAGNEDDDHTLQAQLVWYPEL